MIFSFYAFKKRRNHKTVAKTLLLGIVLTNFIILSSLIYFGNSYDIAGKNVFIDNDAGKPFLLIHGSEYEISRGNTLFYSLLYGLMNALKVGTFGLKYPIIYAASFDFPCDLGLPYGLYITFLTIVTPFIFGGFLVTYLKSLRYFFWYYLKYRRKDIYYFSELNDKSLVLAEDIYNEEKKKALIVFCNCDKSDSSFFERSSLKKFIILPESELDFVTKHFNKKKKKYYFEISKDDSKNLENTKKLLDDYKQFKGKFFKNVKVFLFMNSTLFGSELISKEEKKINVILVDPVKTSVYNLLFEKPLVESIKNDIKDKEGKILLSIAVFGNGPYAKEFFKNSIWASVLDERYKTCISYVDNNATLFEGSLKRDCPELFKQNYDLHFYNANLQTNELSKILKENLSKSNYIVIDTGNDEENLKLAIFTRVFYLQNSNDFNHRPFIALRIQNSKMVKRVNEYSLGKDKLEKDISYNFYSFGDENEIYSHKLLIDSPIEKLAINCKATYDSIYNYIKKMEDEKKSYDLNNYELLYETEETTVNNYNKNEFEKSTNRAAAVHIKNKLFLMGLKLVEYDDSPTEEQINDNTKALEIFNKTIDKSEYNKNLDIEKLKQIEHERWNAFHYCEGWKNTTLEETLIYRNYINEEKKHKYLLGKMHACLCAWEQLDKVEKKYGPFKVYDEIFIREISRITGCDEDKEGNISGAKFLLATIN